MLSFEGFLAGVLFLRPEVLIGLWRCDHTFLRTAPPTRTTTLPTELIAPLARSVAPLMALYTKASGRRTPHVTPSMLFSRLNARLLRMPLARSWRGAGKGRGRPPVLGRKSRDHDIWRRKLC